tara:strand:- start:30016 stop:32283 length:2268 start_codon:yes stop_codon:yes gene_type:complete
MNDSQMPVFRDLVLVGGGHSHVIVLKRFGMNPMPGVRVTVIARDLDTPYSGMLPGLLAGHYKFDDAHIDLGRLCKFAGARLYHDEAVGLNPTRGEVICRQRPPVSYDVVSFDIGVTPRRHVVGSAAHAVPVKPIGKLVSRWHQLLNRVRNQMGVTRIGIVGTGAAGVELTLALQYALTEQVRDRAQGQSFEFHLFGSPTSLLPTHNRRIQAKFQRVFAERGVKVHLGSRVISVDQDGLCIENGCRHDLDEIIWATEAEAPAWLQDTTLELDDRGFIRVDDTLQSVSHETVFAAGDVASMVNHPREKAGVFAVRQGPPLATNLRRALSGRALQPYRPQNLFLSLISTGDQYAIASRGGWAFEGHWVWRWKDWIDRRFMKQFSDLPTMDQGVVDPPAALIQLAAPDLVQEISSVAMRCGGCGSKVGATVLDRVLTRLCPVQRDDVVLGLGTPDDASVEKVPAGMVAVRTVDAFRTMVDDPYMFGRITANHCLGDIYAMGAEPATALAIATVPVAPENKMEQMLEELLTGAVEVLNEAGMALVGGHTKEGFEVELGLSLSGFAEPGRLLRKSGMRPGDKLILTKPIGTGTLFAAHMRLKAKGRWVDNAIRSMIQSSLEASRSLRRHGATACTDVTGFGVVGHVLEMTRASQLNVTLLLSSMPVLTGAIETARAGLLSSLQPQNVRLRRTVANHETVRLDERYPLLFDPQTSGGLLASIPADNTKACLAELRNLGYTEAVEVGFVQSNFDPETPIAVEI